VPIVIHNHWIDRLAIVAGFLSGLALYPQVYLLMTTSPEGVSIATFAIIFFNSIVWLVYSMHRGLWTLAIPSVLNIIASGAVLVWAAFS